ncbi:double zinc ribbon and ankyrin repeat-containing protein 1 [Anabas testudineus]|uniref:Double zinc ribbon and ankyrin repeat-containing protein 1 n=1 Tax=Anabas testudineus TaxID=64144 RepID=A0AAQ6ICT8_ANATE|nr:double zinc ribbon and ankyrin repeat-containing protein 1 [Anabas testudineus]
MTAGAVSAPLIIPIAHLQTHRAKNHIDTSTPISIQSDTPGVLIFYTLDGSKPVAVQRGSACSSRKYSEPILLPAGRVSVRAVALSSDGRESSTVTKVFSVQSVDSHNTNVLQNGQQRPSEGTSSSSENSAGYSLRPPELKMTGHGSPTPTAPSGSSQSRSFPSASPGVVKQLSSTETSRIQRGTDFLRCAQCLSFRPSDPFAHFCAQCGAVVPPLPQQRLPPAEGGQTVRCVFCNTVVPVNTGTCLICEASVHQQLQPQASRTLQDHMMCVRCGTGNPAHVSSCLVCETHLQPVGGRGNSAPSVPSAGSRMLSCSTCKRMNHTDARFCDWCGSKPAHAARCVICQKCGASGHPYAFYCAACGAHLEAPAPPSSHSDIIRPVRASAPNQASGLASQKATWQTTPSSKSSPKVKVAPPTEDQSTQTVGLFFPSATELHRKQQQRQIQHSRQQASRDRQPLLSAISPGRGYWRQQLDHVCAHLRSYTQNNPSFRTLLAEPRLGRIVSAVVQEDQYEVSLTISFVSTRREGKQVGAECDAADPAGESPGPAGGVGRIETLSSVTEKSADSSTSKNGSDRSARLMKPNLTPKPPVKDVQLLKELGPGRGQISLIQQLLDQGADPSCCDSDGRHTLMVAVVNGHHDALPVLVQRGADVNQQSGRMKNTALHEAAALGSEGLQCAQVLLSCKAGMRRRNAAGQTPYDVAVNSGCKNMVSLLAAQTGLDLLGKLGKPKLKLDIF